MIQTMTHRVDLLIVAERMKQKKSGRYGKRLRKRLKKKRKTREDLLVRQKNMDLAKIYKAQ
jgi:hypothetical protein